MTAKRQIGPIRLVESYLQCAAIESIRAKFNQNCFKTERLVCVVTDRHSKKDKQEDRHV